MLSGDNGILQKATDAKEYSERAEIVENAKLDILAKLSEKKGENITKAELEEILTSSNYKTQGTLSNEENILERTLTSKDAKYQIPVSEIYNGNLETSQSAKTISFTIYLPSVAEETTCTAVEGQTWYEWALATKDEDSSRYLSGYWFDSLQNVIIELYNQDTSSEMLDGDHNTEDYWIFQSNGSSAAEHVNDVINENGYYTEGWSYSE